MRKRGSLVMASVWLALGVAVLIGTSNYPSVYGSLGPAFFPRAVAIFLIALSVIDVITQILALRKSAGKGENVLNARSLATIAMVTAGMAAMVLLMKYVHVLAGIALFLLGYLLLVTKLEWKKAALVTVGGTALVYLAIVLLKIPM